MITKNGKRVVVTHGKAMVSWSSEKHQNYRPYSVIANAKPGGMDDLRIAINEAALYYPVEVPK